MVFNRRVTATQAGKEKMTECGRQTEDKCLKEVCQAGAHSSARPATPPSQADKSGAQETGVETFKWVSTFPACPLF